MRYSFIYSLISINLFINILGLFLLALEVIGKEKLLKFKELLYNTPIKYKKRKKGLITLSFFIMNKRNNRIYHFNGWFFFTGCTEFVFNLP